MDDKSVIWAFYKSTKGNRKTRIVKTLEAFPHLAPKLICRTLRTSVPRVWLNRNNPDAIRTAIIESVDFNKLREPNQDEKKEIRQKRPTRRLAITNKAIVEWLYHEFPDFYPSSLRKAYFPPRSKQKVHLCLLEQQEVQFWWDLFQNDPIEKRARMLLDKFSFCGPHTLGNLVGFPGLQHYKKQLVHIAKPNTRMSDLKLERGGSCEKCGYSKNLAALHFHHKDPSSKIAQVGQMPVATMEQEADKCVLLCANCHAEEHHPEYSQI